MAGMVTVPGVLPSVPVTTTRTWLAMRHLMITACALVMLGTMVMVIPALTLTSVLPTPRTVVTLMPLVPTLQAVTRALVMLGTMATVIHACAGPARAEMENSDHRHHATVTTSAARAQVVTVLTLPPLPVVTMTSVLSATGTIVMRMRPVPILQAVTLALAMMVTKATDSRAQPTQPTARADMSRLLELQ